MPCIRSKNAYQAIIVEVAEADELSTRRLSSLLISSGVVEEIGMMVLRRIDFVKTIGIGVVTFFFDFLERVGVGVVRLSAVAKLSVVAKLSAVVRPFVVAMPFVVVTLFAVVEPSVGRSKSRLIGIGVDEAVSVEAPIERSKSLVELPLEPVEIDGWSVGSSFINISSSPGVDGRLVG